MTSDDNSLGHGGSSVAVAESVYDRTEISWKLRNSLPTAVGWAKLRGMSRPKAKEARELLRRKLDERGLSMTSQRAAVYEYLSRVSHHPTAEEIFLQIKGELPKISLATVYKNLEALAACGAITKLDYGDSSARYDVRTDKHYHARCLGCDRIWDVEAGKDTQAFEQIKPQAGFRVEDYRLEILGHCRDCSR